MSLENGPCVYTPHRECHTEQGVTYEDDQQRRRAGSPRPGAKPSKVRLPVRHFNVTRRMVLVVACLGGLPVLIMLGVVAGIFYASFGALVETVAIEEPNDVVDVPLELSSEAQIQFTVHATRYWNSNCHRLYMRAELLRDDNVRHRLLGAVLITDPEEDSGSGSLFPVSPFHTITVQQGGTNRLKASWELQPSGCKATVRGLELQVRRPRG